jgi:hypothetical protein
MMMSKTHKGIDYSTALILAAVFVSTIRYAAAFLASDVGKITGVTSEIVTFLLGLSGLAMGVLSTFGTAYLFDGWRKKMPAAGGKWSFKFQSLTVFVFAAFIFELAILVPFTVSRMNGVSMTEVLNNGVWWWSFSVNAMPLLLIGGVSVGNQIVSVSSTEGAESFRQLTESQGKVSDNLPKGWRKVRKTLTDEQVRNIAIDQSKNIAFYYKVDERTARNWRKYAQAELEKLDGVK